MLSTSVFFQVAATLLGTLLISGVLAETRALGSAETSPQRKWVGAGLLMVVIAGFVVGELLCLDVLVGQPPTREEHLYVEVALAACALATLLLAVSALTNQTRWWLGGLVVTTAVSVGAFFLARGLENRTYSGFTHEGLLAQCPGVAKNSTYIGVVDSQPDSAVRATPGLGLDNRIVHRYPNGCVLGFSGFCLGTPVSDTLNTRPDARWLKLQGETDEVITSANVRDLPTSPSDDIGRAAPTSCKGGFSSYEPLELVGLAGSAIRAKSRSASELPAVGFAVAYATPGGGDAWHRLAPDRSPEDGISTRLQVAGFRRPAEILAVTCLAAEVPAGAQHQTALLSLGAYRGRGHNVASGFLAEGRQVACALGASE